MLNENAIMVNIKRGRESLGLEPSEMADRLGVELRVYKMYESGVPWRRNVEHKTGR